MSSSESTTSENHINDNNNNKIITADQQSQGSAALRPSLYEVSFKPQVGVDLHTQLPEASIHKGLLCERNVVSAALFAKALQDGKLVDSPSALQQPPQEQDAASTDETKETNTNTKITKELINKEVYGERAIVLHNVLSPQECLEISSLVERIEMHDANQDHRYRNNMRCEINSIPLSQVLFQRVFPFIEHEKVVSDANKDDFVQGELMKGYWKITGLNDHFRLCFYLAENNGHFGPHYDGEYAAQDVCSIKTFMLYLNDDYEGGYTNFLREHGLYFDEARKIYCSPPEHVVAGLKAKQGDCLIFDHKILHEGSQVLSGKKFIFRTEIMYTRVGGDVELTEMQKKGKEYLAQARYYEDCKDYDTAVKFYQKAFKAYPELEKLV